MAPSEDYFSRTAEIAKVSGNANHSNYFPSKLDPYAREFLHSTGNLHCYCENGYTRTITLNPMADIFVPSTDKNNKKYIDDKNLYQSKEAIPYETAINIFNNEHLDKAPPSHISPTLHISNESHASLDLSACQENEDYNEVNVSTSLSSALSNPSDNLKNIKKDNLNRLIIGQININSLRNKFDSLIAIINGNIDILVVNETKLDSSFPTQQFVMEGYAQPYRLDISSNAGGTLIYVRDDIPCRILNTHSSNNSIEGICLEINLRTVKCNG